MSFRSGFITIIGRPNVGKSTLLNAMLGEKISIVSSKPQTTRNVIRGVKNLPDCQMVFIDTPGVHATRGLLNEYMMKEISGTLTDIDAAVFMVEATSEIQHDDREVIEKFLKRVSTPVILCINKVDKASKPGILPLIVQYSKLYPFKEVVPLSALTGDGVGVLLDILTKLMPEGPKYFPDDAVTDQPERFIAAEIVREKVFELTKDEVPYSVAVVTENFREDRKKKLITIHAVINCERDSQKGIIIGKGGEMLKKIGTAARLDIERLLGSRVFLQLFVRVEKDWTKNPKLLKEFGY